MERKTMQMASEKTFKYGVSIALIVEFSILLVMAYTSILEYDGTSVETIGLTVVFIAVFVVSSVMLYSAYKTFTLKSLQA